MIAIKATMRIGFLPIKDEAFAALTPAALPPQTPGGNNTSGDNNNGGVAG